MKNYETYLLDADGTLFDFDKAEETSLRKVFLRHGLPFSEDTLARYQTINREMWRRYEKGEIDRAVMLPLRFRLLFDELHLDGDVETVNGEYLSGLGDGCFLLDGALELCTRIRSSGKQSYIITNGVRTTQTKRLLQSPLKPLIADIFISEEIGYQKPHREYFEIVFSRMPEKDRSGMLIVGDSLTADIAGGMNAGIDTCWYNPLNKVNDTGIRPTFEIRSLDELTARI